MNLQKHMKLVDLLTKKTAKGELRWTESYGDGFQVSFRDNSVQIRRSESSSGQLVEVLLINGEGAIAETFSDEDLDAGLGQDWFTTLDDLFTAAQRNARGADKVLDEILLELDDDIPF